MDSRLFMPTQKIGLHTAISGHNVIITGQCGTGKTYLLKCIIKELQKTRNVAVTSMTGMASLQLEHGATTIHHWAGILDCRNTYDELMILFDSDDRFQAAKTRILKANTLVIDEIGMMSKTVFEMVEFVCRYVRGNTTVFGGLQVIATGDFKQLPPVPNRRFSDDGTYCFLSELFARTFPHHINLKEVVRQNEEDLVQAINQLCDGSPSKETEQLLQRLNRPIHNPVSMVKLFGTNFDADYVNHDMLDSMEGNDRMYKAIDEGEVKLLMHSAAPRNLLLKVGAPVILIRNLKHNLFNGTKGEVCRLTDEGPIVCIDGKNVAVPITKFEVYDKTKKRTLATRHQFPIKLAFALTVHRAQGQTIPFVEVDCFSFFAPGQMGVAVGRAVSKKGLRIVNYNSTAAHLKHTPDVYEFYKKQFVETKDDLSCCQTDEAVYASSSQPSQKPEDTEPEEPNQFPWSDSDSDTVPQKECPWDVKDFLQLNIESSCVADIPAGFEDSQNLKKHIEFLYSSVVDILAKKPKMSSEWTGAMKDLNTFLLSDILVEQCKKLFKTGTITKPQNKFSSKLCIWLFEKETELRSSNIIQSQTEKLQQQGKSSTDTDFSEAAKAKLRYIAGACIHKISSRLRHSVVRSLGKSKGKFIRRFNYQKQNLLKQLQIKESEVSESADQASFAEIEFKQGPSRGLRIINDAVFEYFLKLNSALQVCLSPASFHLHGQNIHIVCRENLGDNEDLLDAWIQLFSNTCTSEDIEDDVYLSLILDLNSVINEHFVRIALIEGLHTFKAQVPRKKKQALRQKIQALGEKGCKDKGEKRKAAAVEIEEEDEYMCRECGNACEWEPADLTLESLACDVCNSWYHYKCVGVKGSEAFLKNSHSKWKCLLCKNSKGKGKGKGKRSEQ